MFISCSDDETVKIWGVSQKLKVEVFNQSGKAYKDNVIKFDVKNENEERKEEDEAADVLRRSGHVPR